MRLAGLIVAGSACAALLPAVAGARPPVKATVTPEVGMAGVKLGQAAGAVRNGRLTGRVLSGWGRLQNSFCFEGEVCGWQVKGPGSVTVGRNSVTGRVFSLETTAPGWRTARSLGRGSTAAAVLGRYPSATFETLCSTDSFGGPRPGLVVRHRRSTTIFLQATQSARIRGIFLINRRLSRDPRCG